MRKLFFEVQKRQERQEKLSAVRAMDLLLKRHKAERPQQTTILPLNVIQKNSARQ